MLRCGSCAEPNKFILWSAFLVSNHSRRILFVSACLGICPGFLAAVASPKRQKQHCQPNAPYSRPNLHMMLLAPETTLRLRKGRRPTPCLPPPQAVCQSSDCIIYMAPKIRASILRQRHPLKPILYGPAGIPAWSGQSCSCRLTTPSADATASCTARNSPEAPHADRGRPDTPVPARRCCPRP